MTRIEKAVEFMIETANDDSHGYDQTHRNGPDYDCSSLVSTALYTAGFSMNPQSWTGNMYDRLIELGFEEIKGNVFIAGDIHLTPGKHTCMHVDSENICEARINELGKTTGGKTGDQTGKEIMIRKYYTPSYGWKYHLRYAGESLESPQLKPIEVISREVIAGKWGNGEERKNKLESAGYNYKLVQLMVNALLKGHAKYLDEVAREVIAGKWGNGADREKAISAAGYDYKEVQKRVNAMLEKING